MNSKLLLGLVSALTIFYAASLYAQVPHFSHYQGRVAVNGTNFTGTGFFKFALVNGGTAGAAQATAAGSVTGGFLVGITVVNGGSGYTSAPTVTITDATGSGATAIASVSGGSVTAITVQNAGHGYSSSPTITIDPPPSPVSYLTFWSNDGTSIAGSEPSGAFALTATQGLFNVLLGDTTLTNMSAIPPTVFTNSDVRLRIWFNDGVNGFSQLSPDQRIATVGYAFTAANVPDGTITASKIPPNTIDITKLAFPLLTNEVDPKVAMTNANAVPRWNGTTLVDGAVFDNGNVGIGTTSPAARLDVSGGFAINGQVVINSSRQWVGEPVTGLQGPKGDKGDPGPPGPTVTLPTSAICASHVDPRHGNCSTLCARWVGGGLFDDNCRVYADNGTCSATGDSNWSQDEALCCICAP